MNAPTPLHPVLLSRADWLTLDRARAYRWLLLGLTLLVAIGWVAASHHGRDAEGKPIGTDFLSYWAAARLALSGQPGAVYDVVSQYAAETQGIGYDAGIAPFYYPPPYLLLCLPLGLLPYFVALTGWIAATGTAYALVVRRWMRGLPDRTLTLFAFPALMVCAGHGQNGFFATALMGSALLLMARRPWLAGLLLGTLALKPQLALIVPLVLAVRGEWRAFLGAAIGCMLWCAAATFAFGWGIWHDFLTTGSAAARAQMELGLTDPAKMASLYGAVRVLGGGNAMAYTLQGLLALTVVAMLLHLARAKAPAMAQNAALAAGVLLVTPYLFDYDETMLALPMAWLLREGQRRGFLPWEKLLLGLAFVLPLFGRPMSMSLHLPIAPLVMTTLFWACYRAAGQAVALQAAAEDIDPIASIRAALAA